MSYINVLVEVTKNPKTLLSKIMVVNVILSRSMAMIPVLGAESTKESRTRVSERIYFCTCGNMVDECYSSKFLRSSTYWAALSLSFRQISIL